MNVPVISFVPIGISAHWDSRPFHSISCTYFLSVCHWLSAMGTAADLNLHGVNSLFYFTGRHYLRMFPVKDEVNSCLHLSLALWDVYFFNFESTWNLSEMWSKAPIIKLPLVFPIWPITYTRSSKYTPTMSLSFPQPPLHCLCSSFPFFSDLVLWE